MVRKSLAKTGRTKALVEDGELNFQDDMQDFEKQRQKFMLQRSGKTGRNYDKSIVQPLIGKDEESEQEDDEEVEDVKVDKAQAEKTLRKQLEKQKQQQDNDDEEDDDDEDLAPKNGDIQYRGAWSDSEDESGDEEVAAVESKNNKQKGTKGDKWKSSEFHEQAESKVVKRPKTNKELEEMKAEEEEAIDLQQKRTERLSMMDHFDEDLIPVMSDKKEEKQKEDTDDIKTIPEGELSSVEKLKIVTQDSKELLELVSDLKQKMKQLREQAQPLLLKVKNNRLATSEGISYLETKYHLLLGYCMNIVFYLMMKASGKKVRDHPVIEQLVEQRLLLEHIKPIDEKMKYQIDKLISIASTIQTGSSSEAPAASETRHGPNIDNLVSTSEPVDKKKKKKIAKEEASSDEEELADNFGEQAEDGGDEDDVYVVPKVVPVAFEEKANKKAQRQQERMEKKIKKSEWLGELKAIVDDEPEELPMIGAEHKKKRTNDFANELERFETDNFTRKQLTKAEKKKLRHQETSLKNELEDLESFNDLIGIDKYLKEKKSAQETKQKATLLEYIGDEKEAREYAKEKLDLDLGEEKEESPKKRKRAQQAEEEEDAGEEEQANKKQRLSRDEEDELIDEDQRDESGKRAANKTILVNRGLTPNRRTDIKNPRVKLKKKFHAKTEGRRNLAEKSSQRNNYKGESRINKNRVRSVKINT